MALPCNGLISIADICGQNGLNIPFGPPARELHELANLAATNTTPYINRATPSMFDWYCYAPVPPNGFQVSVNRYTDDTLACGNTGPYQILYAHEVGVPNITTLYTSPGMEPGTEFDGGDLYFKCAEHNDVGDGWWLRIYGSDQIGQIDDRNYCYTSNTWNFSAFFTLRTDLCGSVPQNITYWSRIDDCYLCAPKPSQDLLGCRLFTSSSLTTPVVGGNRWIKNANIGYQINDFGYIIGVVTCAATAFEHDFSDFQSDSSSICGKAGFHAGYSTDSVLNYDSRIYDSSTLSTSFNTPSTLGWRRYISHPQAWNIDGDGYLTDLLPC